MSMTDPIADLITRIRNGQMVSRASIKSPASNMRKNVLDVLQSEGFIRGYEETEVRKGVKELKIELKYVEGKAAIQNIEKISKPGRRVYSSIDDLKKVNNGLGVSILSTPKGILSDVSARTQKVGGEVLISVF